MIRPKESDPTSRNPALGADLIAARQGDANDSVLYNSLLGVGKRREFLGHLFEMGVSRYVDAWRLRWGILPTDLMANNHESRLSGERLDDCLGDRVGVLVADSGEGER